MALGTEYIIKYLSDISLAVKGAKDLEAMNARTAKNITAQYGEVTKSIGKLQPTVKFEPITSGRYAGASKEIRTYGEVVKTANGNYLEFSQTHTLINGQLVKTSGAMKDVTNQFSQTSIESEKANKSFKSMFDNMARLAGRAVLTIPIWMALRATVQGTISVFTDGFNDLVQESLALDKVKQTLTVTGNALTETFEKIKTETKSLALETGVSHEKIIATYQKFSSVGMDFASAMQATNLVTKLGVITQSDATVAAEGFSHALAVLVDSNASASEKQKQINDIMSLTSQLYKNGGFDVETFTNSLAKFAVTAKSVNFTTSQTLSILATLSKSGLDSAGGLLRNSIGQLLVNADKLASSLNVKINPALDDTFSILMKVLEQINKLQTTNDFKGLEAAKDAMKDIFGGTRSAVPVAALASLYDALKKNLALIGDINKFNDAFKDSESVLGNVVARYHTANSEIGKGFVSGLLGAEDFDKALEKVVVTLNSIEKNAENVGKILGQAFSVKGMENISEALPIQLQPKLDTNFTAKLQDQIIKATHGQASKIDMAVLFDKLLQIQSLKLDVGISDKDINTAIINIRKQLLTIRAITTEIPKDVDKTKDKEKALNDLLLKKQEILKLEGYLRKELSATGLSEVDVERKILEFHQSITLFSETDNELQKELVNHLQAIEQIELRRSRARGLIDNQLELLKAQGATTLQVVQQRIEMERMFGLNQTRADLLRNELELNKEITKEKSNQNKVSSDSLKLFQIAQKSGIQTATTVGNFVAGKIPVQAFETGGKFSDLMPILKEFFSAEVEQKKAQEFFFKGQGAFIPIPERQAIQDVRPIDLSSIKLPDINTQVGGINVEIKKLFKEEDTAKQIMDAMLDAIRNSKQVEDAINEKIDSF
jgi:hypothetical protein